MNRLLLVCAVLMAGWLPVDAAPAVAGYLLHYRAGIIDQLLVEKLTDIIFFSIAPKADGSLDTQNAKPEVLRQLTTRAPPSRCACIFAWAAGDCPAALRQ